MKTVGFLKVLQLSPEPKLTMPLTSQEPFSAWQFSGPPESPCTRRGRCQAPGLLQRQAWEAGEGRGVAPQLSTVREKRWFGAAFALVGEVLGCQISSLIAV